MKKWDGMRRYTAAGLLVAEMGAQANADATRRTSVRTASSMWHWGGAVI